MDQTIEPETVDEVEGGASTPAPMPPTSMPVVARRSVLRRPLAPVFAAAGALGLTACDMTSTAFDRNLHLLRRLTYGPKPADKSRIDEIGEGAWLTEQLDTTLLDTSAVTAKLAAYPSLQMEGLALLQANPDAQSATIQGAYLRVATAIRAVESPAQLHERMVEFWSDHFNVYAQGRLLNLFKIVEDRTVQRQHALGRFKDLLVASAQSPAMLEYLDNSRSRVGAVNENYARELLELHTLGVDGGYTEADVVACARLLTGWGVGLGTFVFRPNRHDAGPLTIMGWSRPATGNPLDHGVAFLHWLAEQPRTAQFICRKIAVRFVSDNPDPALVDAMAAAWTANDTQIGPVLTAMVNHPAFDASAGTKFRRPWDYFVWLLRAVDARVSPSTDLGELQALAGTLGALGQIPFDWPAPNGYPDVEGAWLNTGALLNRWNLVGDVLANAFGIVSYDAGGVLASLQGLTGWEIYDEVAQRGLLEPVTSAGRWVLDSQTGWSGTVAPTASEIAGALPAIAIGLLASADAQYR